MTNTNTRKNYRFDDATLIKLQQLQEVMNAEIEGSGIRTYSEKDIVVFAIEYYHAAKFGKDILNQELNKLELIISNTIDLVLRNYVDKFATALNTLNQNDDFLKVVMLMIVRSSKMIPENYEGIYQAVQKQKHYNELIDEVVAKVNEEANL